MTKVPQSTTALAPFLLAVRSATCALLIGIGISPTAQALDFTPDEQAVWRMEEQYWRDVQAGDVESYLTLWHENFVGWPCFAWEPSDKSKIGGWGQGHSRQPLEADLSAAAVFRACHG